MAKLGEFTITAGHGHIRWRRWYFELYKSPELHAVLTIVAILTQCIYVLTHRAWENRLWRVAVCFVPYFLCIGFPYWESHFTITRHALPITLAFNLLPRREAGTGVARLVPARQLSVPFDIYQFYDYLGANRVHSAASGGISTSSTRHRRRPSHPSAPASARVGRPQEWNEQEGWRWATGSIADIVIVNRGREAVTARISFASPEPPDAARVAGDGRQRGTLVGPPPSRLFAGRPGLPAAAATRRDHRRVPHIPAADRLHRKRGRPPRPHSGWSASGSIWRRQRRPHSRNYAVEASFRSRFPTPDCVGRGRLTPPYNSNCMDTA